MRLQSFSSTIRYVEKVKFGRGSFDHCRSSGEAFISFITRPTLIQDAGCIDYKEVNLENSTSSSELQIIILTVFLCSSFIRTRRFPYPCIHRRSRPLRIHKLPQPKKHPSALDYIHRVGIVLSQLALLPKEIAENFRRRKVTFCGKTNKDREPVRL
jgi:hypothetical protein